MVYKPKPNKPEISYNTREWDLIEAWLKDELQETYKELARPDQTEEKTQQLRGKASFISMMLDFKTLPAATMPQF